MTERPARRLLAVSAALAVAAGVLGLSAAQSAGRGRDDLSPKDLKRVAAVTKPATDFSKAEQYEAMSAGAATSLAAIDSLIDQTKTIERVIASLDLGKIELEGSDSLDNPNAVFQ